MANKKPKRIPAPPPQSASDSAKAAYYGKHDPVDLLDAGYFQEEGLFEGDRRVVDLRPERGLITIPIEAKVVRRLLREARRSGTTPSELASRCLAEGIRKKAG